VSQTPYNTEKTLSLSMTSVVIVVLHDDHINIAAAAHPGSANELRTLSESFFSSLGLFSAATGKRNMDSMRDTLHKSCSSNHIRLEFIFSSYSNNLQRQSYEYDLFLT